MRRRFVTLLVLLAVLPLLGMQGCRPGRPGPRPPVRMNEIQVLASHNSYHREPEPALLAALRDAAAAEADGFEYTHRPLAEEFDAGVRQIELDLFVDDPEGGRYAAPVLIPLLGLEPADPALREPGLKVLHVQEVDYRSTCPTFVRCLRAVKAWSDAHPGHLPITIQLEAKDEVIPDPGLGFVTPHPWTGADLASVDDEIRSVFPARRIITPGEVRGRKDTLAEAVRAGRWPTLDRARGRVMFMLDNRGAKRDAYRAAVPDLADRLLFVDAPPDDPDAAVTVVNDPVGDAARIRDLVALGFSGRPRADADTVEARTGATARREAAWASGAQYVSTDYVFPDDRFGTGYVVTLPGGGVARCNPVSATRACAHTHLQG